MKKDYQDAINNDFGVKNDQGVEINAIRDKRLDSNYTCKDQNWETGKFQGDIYISTPDATHNAIVNHHENPAYKIPESGYPGTSGYFTDEKTASGHFKDDKGFDSVGLGHTLQQAPHYNEKAALEAIANDKKYCPEYNRYLDCFRVNEEKMQEHFGTTDFYAAMAQCKENTAWGEGGGFQGYNSYINEMINKGVLEYVPEKSRICTNNECFDYAERKKQVSEEAKAVNEYIEKNNVEGKQGERLGFNELSQNINKTENDVFNKVSANRSGIDKIAAGGGTHAPPEQGKQSTYTAEKLANLEQPKTGTDDKYESTPFKYLEAEPDALSKKGKDSFSGEEKGMVKLSGKDGMST